MAERISSSLTVTNVEVLPREPFSFGVRNPIRIDAEGWVHVPQGPGLGAELDWDALENHVTAEV